MNRLMALILAVSLGVPSLVFAQWTDDDFFNTPLGNVDVKIVKYLLKNGKSTEEEAQEIARSVRGTVNNSLTILSLMMVASEGDVKGGNNAGIGLMGVNEIFIGKKSKELYGIDLGVCGVRKAADLSNIRKNICAGDEVLSEMKVMAQGNRKGDIRLYGVNVIGKKGKDEPFENYQKKIVDFEKKVAKYEKEIREGVYGGYTLEFGTDK
jgi:hypothetical protein